MQVFVSPPKFYLTSHKKLDRYTSLMMYIRINEKPYKFPAGVKVKPIQWDCHSQMARVSNLQSPLDNHNNEIVNATISYMAAKIKDFLTAPNLEYENNLDIFEQSHIAQQIRNIFNMKKKKTATTTCESLMLKIKAVIRDSHDIADSTKENYQKGLKVLGKFLSSKNEITDFQLSIFSGKLLKEFAIWVRENCKNDKNPNKPQPLTISGVNSIIRYAYSAIRLVMKKDSAYDGKIGIKLKELLFKDKTNRDNSLALTNEEVMKLYRYKCSSHHDELARDWFVLECVTGCRVGDLLTIDRNIQHKDGYTFVTFINKKTPNKKNKFAIIFKIAEEILEKYNYTVPKNLTRFLINDRIKKIAKECGISGKHTLGKHYANSANVVEIIQDRADCIKTHTGRKTFITLLLLRGWSYPEVARFTEQNATTIERFYDKATDEAMREFKRTKPEDIVLLFDDYECDWVKAKIGANKQAENPHQDPQQPQQSSYIENLVKESKQVLAMLSVPAYEYEDVEDYDTIRTLLSNEEHKLLIAVNENDIMIIKDIFNSALPLRERAMKIQELRLKKQ